jgi:flagellum-specific ATP synthase
MPYEAIDGIGLGCLVENEEHPLSVRVGDFLLGQILDGLGRPISDFSNETGVDYPMEAPSPDAMSRTIISEVLPLGVKAVDGLITVGKGQRIGIFAGSGVGKSTLMGMFARNTKADINVIALIGERGREVREFIENDLGKEGMKRSVVVVATSDKPALERKKAAQTATAIAEYFRNKGKDVLLMMDSVTRFAMAQREIGLSLGEPPATKGYTASVFNSLPKLLERAGTGERGSITGIYTVLVEGDNMNEPIGDAVRGILDGHIVLDRKLAQRRHYPAIDVLQSVSRLMSKVTQRSHREKADMFLKLMAAYNENEDFIKLGAYAKGSSPIVDAAIMLHDSMESFLQQDVEDGMTWEECLESLDSVVSPLIDSDANENLEESDILDESFF